MVPRIPQEKPNKVDGLFYRCITIALTVFSGLMLILEFGKNLPFESLLLSNIKYRVGDWNRLASFYAVARKDSRPWIEILHIKNIIILTTLDIVLGSSIAYLLNKYRSLLVFAFTLGTSLMISFFESSFEWLMGWPAGFKLNPQLSLYMGTRLLQMLNLWTAVVVWIFEYFNLVYSFSVVLAIFGCSMFVCFLADFISFICLYITLFNFLIHSIISFQVALLISMFHLFKGKRFNILKRRIEPSEYEMDELLIGTVLFTVFLCLFPTVFVYYLLVCLGSTFVFTVQAAAVCLSSLFYIGDVRQAILRFFGCKEKAGYPRIERIGDRIVVEVEPIPFVPTVETALAQRIFRLFKRFVLYDPMPKRY